MENGFFQQALETAESENAKPGDIVDAFNGRVHKDGISPTITTRPEGKKTAVLPVVEDKTNMEEVKTEETQEISKPKYAIRKLTPRECYRLMNFSDEDFWRPVPFQYRSNRQSGLLHLSEPPFRSFPLPAWCKRLRAFRR